MNETEWNLAKHATWTLDHFGSYFVSKSNGRSEYALGRDFSPEVLSEMKLSQLHQTERQDGVYIHLSNGTPDLKPQVIAACGVNFTHSIMEGLIHALMEHSEQRGILVKRLAWRNKGQTRGKIYEALGVPKSTAERWLKEGLEFMSDELYRVIVFRDSKAA